MLGLCLLCQVICPNTSKTWKNEVALRQPVILYDSLTKTWWALVTKIQDGGYWCFLFKGSQNFSVFYLNPHYLQQYWSALKPCLNGTIHRVSQYIEYLVTTVATNIWVLVAGTESLGTLVTVSNTMSFPVSWVTKAWISIVIPTKCYFFDPLSDCLGQCISHCQSCFLVIQLQLHSLSCYFLRVNTELFSMRCHHLHPQRSNQWGCWPTITRIQAKGIITI